MNEICLKRIMQLLNFPMISILQIFQIHLVCKSTVNWLPEGPAAGAEPSDPPRQAEGRTLGVFNRCTVSVRSRDLLKRNPPPSRLPLTPAPLQLSSSTAVSGTHSKNEPKIEGSRDAKRIPMRSQNRRRIAKMSLERAPGSLSERVR